MNGTPLSIGLVTAFPPGRNSLNEFGFHLAKHLVAQPEVAELVLFADETEAGAPTSIAGVTAKPSWKFNSLATLWRLTRSILRAQPDAVIFNLQFATFGDQRVAGALGLLVPMLVSARRVPTIVILHNLADNVDMQDAGFATNRLSAAIMTTAGRVLTRALLRADLVALTIPRYVEFVRDHYGAKNAILAPHGSFEDTAVPEFTVPAGRRKIMAFGKWGTYKTVDTLLEAYTILLARGYDDLELVLAGTDSPNSAGYMAAIAEQNRNVPHLSLPGYIAEVDVAALFSSATVVAFPYTSTTGSSGVLHQAGEYGRAAVLPRIGDLVDIIEEEGFQGVYFEPGDAESLADALAEVLDDPALMTQLGRKNFAAAAGIPMSEVVHWHLTHIQRLRRAKELAAAPSTAAAAIAPEVPPTSAPSTAAGPTTSAVAGAAFLGIAMLVANAGNYVLNLFLARWFTPGQFADANLMVTLMLTVTSVALLLQLVAARYVATEEELGRAASAEKIAARLRGIALAIGIAIGLAFILPAVYFDEILNTESPWLFVILGLGMPFYIVQSVGRGVMQGRLQFRRLAITFLIEMVVRLSVGIVLVVLGWGVIGATWGLTASFVATWLAVTALTPRRKATADVHAGNAVDRAEHPVDFGAIRAYSALVSVLLLGQIIINNSDIVVAKAVLEPTLAGVYSAIGLVGRAVFFLSWSVATVLFPLVARRQAAAAELVALSENSVRGGTRARSHPRESRDPMLLGGIGAVVAIGLACTLIAFLAGGPILEVVLGPEYGGISAPLGAYAAVTTVFAVANLIATHRLSQGRVRESWMLVAGALAQLVLLLIWHDTIAQLITVQAVAMVALLATMLVAQTSPPTPFVKVSPQ